MEDVGYWSKAFKAVPKCLPGVKPLLYTSLALLGLVGSHRLCERARMRFTGPEWMDLRSQSAWLVLLFVCSS